MIRLTGFIDYFPPSDEERLSSDVFIVENCGSKVSFDVGSSEICKNGADKADTIVLSHFHTDHIYNMKFLTGKKVYCSSFTKKYLDCDCEVITCDTRINDIELILMPTCHAKGSIALLYQNLFLLVGDALCPKIKEDGEFYSVSMLKSTINKLSGIDTKYILPSHTGTIKTKDEILYKLNEIYNKRIKSNEWITAD